MEGLPSSTTLPWLMLLLLLSKASAHEGEDASYPEGSCGASLHDCIDQFEEAFGGPGVIEEHGVGVLTGDKGDFYGLAQFLPPPPYPGGPPLGPGGLPPPLGPGGLPPPLGPGGLPPPLGPGGLPPPLGQGGAAPPGGEGGLAPGLQDPPGGEGGLAPGLQGPTGDEVGLAPGLQAPLDNGTPQRRKRGAPQRRKRHVQNLQNLIKSAFNLKAISSRFRRDSPPGPSPPGAPPGQANPFANFTVVDFIMLDVSNAWHQGIMEQEKTCQFLSKVDQAKFKSAHECAQLRSTDETCEMDFFMLREVLAEDPPEDMYQQVETRMCGPECAGVRAKLDSTAECSGLAEGGAPANVLIGKLLMQITTAQDYSETCSDLRNIMLCPMRKMGCCQILIDQLDFVLRTQAPVQILDLCKIKYEPEHCRLSAEQKNANLIAAGSALQFSVVTMTVAALSLVLTR